MTQFLRSFLPLLVAYTASYVLWYAVLGVGFSNYKLLDFSHYLNPEWLKGDFIGSLMLLHSQPPLMNIIIGIIFKISEAHYGPVFRLLYFALSLGALWNIMRTMRVLSISRTVRVLVLSILLATPSFYLMSTWLGTAHIEFFITSMLVHYLADYLVAHKRTTRTLLLLFASFALLGLIRPQWHLAVFMVLLFAIILLNRAEWKKILLCSVIFILPMGGWYAKNYYLFGFYGPSSWMGSNMALVAQLVAEDLKAEGVEVKVDSPDFPAQFDMPKVLTRVPPKDFANLPSVLAPYKSTDEYYLAYAKTVPPEQRYILYNLNYIGMIQSSKMDMQDAKKIITEHPKAYIERVLTNMMLITLTPAWLHQSLNLIDVTRFVTPGLRLASIYGCGVFYGLLPLIMLGICVMRARNPRYQFVFILLMIAGYILLSSAAINGYEGERMRWNIQPVYMIFAAIFLENVRKWWDSKRHG